MRMLEDVVWAHHESFPTVPKMKLGFSRRAHTALSGRGAGKGCRRNSHFGTSRMAGDVLRAMSTWSSVSSCQLLRAGELYLLLVAPTSCIHFLLLVFKSLAACFSFSDMSFDSCGRLSPPWQRMISKQQR